MTRLGNCLRGVKVLDLSRYLPGPLATLLLADLGADVLKIEPPAGDEMRDLGPRGAAGEPLYFEALNAGKRTLRLDLKREDDRARLLDLARDADVLVESFRPGVMARLGLDEPALRAANPGLVYCSLSGYGASGPLAQAAGHDAQYLAACGVLHRNGEGRPGMMDPPLCDGLGSMWALVAILGALRARDGDGLGCALDVALADAMMPLQQTHLAALGRIGHVPMPGGSYLNGGAAYYNVYVTRDARHVALGAVEEKFWRAFCVAAGHPEWLARRHEAVPQHGLRADLAAFFRGFTRDECMAHFEGVDCCLAPVLALDEAVASPHHCERALVVRAPDGAFQSLLPVKVDGQAPPLRAPLASAPQARWRGG